MRTVIWFLTLTVLILAILVNIESDPALYSVTQSAIVDRYHADLFQFVLHPDTVEMWFLWITHFQPADKKPVGVGKQYQAIYSVPFLGDRSMLFQVKKFVPDTCLIMESESIFRPRFEVEAIPVKRGEQTRLTFHISYRRSSLLFQYTVGPILQALSRHYIGHSLAFLQDMPVLY